MPFITEEIWQTLMDYLPVEPGRPESLVVAPYPVADASLIDREAEREIGAVTEMIRAIRNLRAEFRIPNNQPLQASVHAPAIESALATESDAVRALGRVESLSLGANGAASSSDQVTLILSSGTVVVPLGGIVDIDKEKTRLAGELADAAKNIERLEGRLSNEEFTSKAPEEVVERERARLAGMFERRDRLQETLSQLGG
jgi:valyl-tRNA synthetase